MREKNDDFGNMLRNVQESVFYDTQPQPMSLNDVSDGIVYQNQAETPKVSDVYREVLRGIIKDKTSSTQDLFAKVQALKQSLEGRFIEREPEILGVLAGLFANEPVLLIGPPGTGKTKLVEKLGEAINGKYYYYLLHQFMEPDELLGPPNVKKYINEGKYERSETGGLQQANIAFFDEPFKASSPVRNMLLDIMLYRRYKSGDQEIKLPMIGLFMAANELPDDSEDDAFKDRLVIRVFVKKLSREGRMQMLETQGQQDADRDTTAGQKGIMSVDDVKAIQAEVDRRLVASKSNAALTASFDKAMADLEAGGVVFSDRTFKKVWKVAAACSVIFNESEVTNEDIAAAIYMCAPRTEEDYGIIEDTISKNKLSGTYEATKIVLSVATEIYNKFDLAQKYQGNKDRLTQYVRALDDLDATSQKAKDVEKAYKSNARVAGLVTQLDQLIVKVDEYVTKERDPAKKELARQQAEAEKLRRRESDQGRRGNGTGMDMEGETTELGSIQPEESTETEQSQQAETNQGQQKMQVPR